MVTSPLKTPALNRSAMFIYYTQMIRTSYSKFGWLISKPNMQTQIMEKKQNKKTLTLFSSNPAAASPQI